MCCQLEQRGGILTTPSRGLECVLPMNFIIHIFPPEFFEALNPGSIVCVANFTGKKDGRPKLSTLLTTDSGIDGGTIHTMQLTFTDTAEDYTVLSAQVFSLLSDSLEKKEMVVVEGVLATVGLKEALEYWGTVPRISVSQLTQFLEVGALTTQK